MRFRRPQNAQDVVVSCCILHNMRKYFRRGNENYTAMEMRQQNELSQRVQQLPPQQRLQNFLIDNFFHV